MLTHFEVSVPTVHLGIYNVHVDDIHVHVLTINTVLAPIILITYCMLTSAMLSILGERERPHWLWSRSHMPCRVFYDCRS